MATLTLRAFGPLDAASAWERYSRPDLWSTWSPQIRQVESSADRLVAGATGRVHGPLGVAVDFTVDSWEEGARRWSWTVAARPLGRPRLRMHHGVDARGEGCGTWLELTGPLPVVVGYVPVARLALHRLVH